MVENLDEEKKVTDSDTDSDAGRKLNEELDYNELSEDDEVGNKKESKNHLSIPIQKGAKNTQDSKHGKNNK